MDPANGFTAIRLETLKHLPLDGLDHGYFFETGMLFRLAAIGARVQDHPMKAVYKNETSGLNIWRQMPIFTLKLIRSMIMYQEVKSRRSKVEGRRKKPMQKLH